MSLNNSKHLVSTITYPVMLKKQPYLPPLSCQESKALLEQFRQARRHRQAELRRFVMTNDETKPRDRDEILQSAQHAAEQGQWDDALELLKDAMSLGATGLAVFRLAGDCYQQKDQLEEAVDMYTRCLELDPLDLELYERRGNCYLSLDEPDRAADEFEKYLKMEQPMVDLLVKTGRACLDADRLDRAQELLSVALQINAQDPYLYYTFGELYQRLGQNATANEHYARVTQLDPDFPKPYLEQAEAALEAGHLQTALAQFQSILKLLPQSASIYLRCAEIYCELGDEFANNALTCLTRAIETDKEGPDRLGEDLYFRRGLLLFDQFNDVDAAIEDLGMCLTLNPSHDRALELRPAAYRQRNGPADLERAKADYEVLIQLPSVPAERKGPPTLFLAEYHFALREYLPAARHYVAAWRSAAAGPLDREKVFVALAAAFLEGASVLDVDDPTGQALRAVPALQQLVLERHYAARRALEPTAHTELGYRFLDLWEAYATRLERRREELDTQAKGKKGPARKK
eukprot:EG_transcript_7290